MELETARIASESPPGEEKAARGPQRRRENAEVRAIRRLLTPSPCASTSGTKVSELLMSPVFTTIPSAGPDASPKATYEDVSYFTPVNIEEIGAKQRLCLISREHDPTPQSMRADRTSSHSRERRAQPCEVREVVVCSGGDSNRNGHLLPFDRGYVHASFQGQGREYPIRPQSTTRTSDRTSLG